MSLNLYIKWLYYKITGVDKFNIYNGWKNSEYLWMNEWKLYKFFFFDKLDGRCWMLLS